MDATNAIAAATSLLSILPIPFIFRRCAAKPAPLIAVLIAFFSAVLATGFFFLWQWLEYPVLAYLDGITYALLSLLAVLVAFINPSETSSRRPNSEMTGQTGQHS